MCTNCSEHGHANIFCPHLLQCGACQRTGHRSVQCPAKTGVPAPAVSIQPRLTMEESEELLLGHLKAHERQTRALCVDCIISDAHLQRVRRQLAESSGDERQRVASLLDRLHRPTVCPRLVCHFCGTRGHHSKICPYHVLCSFCYEQCHTTALCRHVRQRGLSGKLPPGGESFLLSSVTSLAIAKQLGMPPPPVAAAAAATAATAAASAAAAAAAASAVPASAPAQWAVPPNRL